MSIRRYEHLGGFEGRRPGLDGLTYEPRCTASWVDVRDISPRQYLTSRCVLPLGHTRECFDNHGRRPVGEVTHVDPMYPREREAAARR